jgi:hypothetical protein
MVAYLFIGIFCAAGPVVLLIAAVTGVERALFIHSAFPADGVIVGLLQAPPLTTRNRARSPIFRFTTNDGRTFTVTSHIAQRPVPWRFGDRVPVLYEPRHPENAAIDAFAQLWEPQVVLGIVGGGFSTLPLLIFLRRSRPRKVVGVSAAGDARAQGLKPE